MPTTLQAVAPNQATFPIARTRFFVVVVVVLFPVCV